MNQRNALPIVLATALVLLTSPMAPAAGLFGGTKEAEKGTQPLTPAAQQQTTADGTPLQEVASSSGFFNPKRLLNRAINIFFPRQAPAAAAAPAKKSSWRSHIVPARKKS